MPAVKTELPTRYKTKSGEILTDKETVFVKMMVVTKWDRIASVIEAFEVDTEKKGWQNVASVMAFEYLNKPKVKEALAELYEGQGLTHEIADRELQYVIEQRNNLAPKISAINEYNKLTGRHAPEESIVTTETLEERIKRKAKQDDK